VPHISLLRWNPTPRAFAVVVAFLVLHSPKESASVVAFIVAVVAGECLIHHPNRATIMQNPYMTPTLHRRPYALALTLALTLAGLIWRLAPLHLPWFLYKYGGSMLWAAALYWLIATILPRLKPHQLALIAALAAAAVEFSRLVHTPAFDAFRLTLAGKLLLGRFFSLRNIAAYWLAIAITAAIDHASQHPSRTGSR